MSITGGMEMGIGELEEILKIGNNPTLNIQVLLLIQCLKKGIDLPVELITKNKSLIIGTVWYCTGHSLVIGSETGIIADIRFSEIDLMELTNIKIGA